MKAKEVAFAALFASLFTLGDFLSVYNFQVVTAFMVVCYVFCGRRVLLAGTFIYGLIDVIFGLGMYWALVLNWETAALTIVLVLSLRPKAYGLAAGLAFLTFSLVDAVVASMLLDVSILAYLVAGSFFIVRGVLSGMLIGAVFVKILERRTNLNEIFQKTN
jgi:hypothetical protein